MRALAITGTVTSAWISRILPGSDMRATPPSRRMSAGTRSSAMTAHAPAASAIPRCLGDPRLLGVRDVHDDAALEHLGETALDAHGALLGHDHSALLDSANRVRSRDSTCASSERAPAARPGAAAQGAAAPRRP